MTFLASGAVAAGAAVAAVVLPLRRRATLLLAVPVLAAGLTFLALLFGSASIGEAAALFAAVVAGAILLARFLPRLVTLGLLLPAPLFLGVTSVEPRGLQIGVIVTGLVVAAFLSRSERLGVRVALALWYAALLGAAFPSFSGSLRVAAVSAVLTGTGLLLHRRAGRADPAPMSAPRSAGVALASGAAAALLVVLLPQLLPKIHRPAGEPGSSRLDRLRAAAPAGGILWPLPSETLFWSDSDPLEHPRLDRLDGRWLAGTAPRGPAVLEGTSRGGLFSLRSAVTPLRAVKDEGELAEIRKASGATILAVRDALPLIVAGTRESDVARAIDDGCRRHGAPGQAFPPVVASGLSSASIHGNGNKGTLKAGTLLVLDVGCRTTSGYTTDLTRTFPVGGRFTPRQRQVVEAVLAAQAEAHRRCRPGAALGSGLVLDQGARNVLKARLGEENMPHSLGHGVGLFAHDPLPKGPLARGMVLTLEPGTYLKGELGVRIEDTYEVTASGCEALTVGLPADPASIEEAMRTSAAPARGPSTPVN